MPNLSNIGLYAKAVVAFLATVGAAAQTALSDGTITASEYGVLISVLLGSVGVLLVPNARTSEVPPAYVPEHAAEDEVV